MGGEKMVEILYTRFYENLPKKRWNNFLSEIPKHVQEKIMRYRKWQDRLASLYGRVIIQRALTAHGYNKNCLENLSITEYGRPFIDDNVYFNLSHSGEYVVCSVSKKGRVGIDIEKVRPIVLSHYQKIIPPKKWKEIIWSDEKEQLFYDYWTMIESALKADGRGFSLPIEDIIMNGHEVILYDKTWFITKVNIDHHYCCNLATTISDPVISVSEVRID